MGAMGALGPAIFKIRLFSTRNLLTTYYCQAGVSTHNGKILLTLSTRNIKIPRFWQNISRAALLLAPPVLGTY